MSQRWLARCSFLLALAAATLLGVFAGLRSLVLAGVALGGACVMAAGAFWFLAYRGPVRWSALALVVFAPVAVVALYVRAGLLWVALSAAALALLAAAIARAALPRDSGTMPARPAAAPRHPFLIMNPQSGGGKVARFALREKAEALGARVAMLEGPGRTDVAALARSAVAQGADLLGVAGGDGTQALVAAVAAEHGLPFLVISAGTRNHFALDLGLDRDNPASCLDALTDGVELRVDLGVAGGHTFVNNASFGVYAEVVRSPAYRDDKRGTTLRTLPGLLRGHEGARLTARADGAVISGPQALLVSNNPYTTTDIAGLGRRPRLDRGALGVIAVTVDSARQAAALVRRGHGPGLTLLATREMAVDSAEPAIPVGIDGETVLLPAPVRCEIRPGALRVLVPAGRPGARVPRPPIDLSQLWRLAVSRA